MCAVSRPQDAVIVVVLLKQNERLPYETECNRRGVSDVNFAFGYASFIAMIIYKVKINKKYPFKKMKVGETFKLKNKDLRGAQMMASYYRNRCKRPINIVI